MTSEFEPLEQLIRESMKGVYTETTIDHVVNPRNVGNMQDADGFGEVTGPCGDTMEIWLKVKRGIITNATFLTDGCGATIATGSTVTEIARGKSIPEAMKINKQHVLNALGSLPEESIHCALLAVNTLKQAIKDYLDLKKEPWKRAYRKY
ncbi:MAG TPA: iron-sulfur cluster assembly scaffold protein [Dehalococcoidia bacterium]|jgi:nitrogen fixation NifU-like protein|nr:iron-sulfur cluster assembly scaffold protein [Dehalococcoidia bacterium]